MFNSIISGPLNSRKLGRTLGINLSPNGERFCSFNCVYCTCEDLHSKSSIEQKLPQPYAIVEQLVDAIQKLLKKAERIDAITFSGNGEPTLHPDFDKIISDVVLIRNLLAPDTKIVVFTNGSTILKSGMRNTIAKADQFIVKLDAGSKKMFQKINRPTRDVSFDQIKNSLLQFKGLLTIQTMFLSGGEGGECFENSTEEEVKIWLSYIREVAPKMVYIGTLKKWKQDSKLKAISKERLSAIAAQVSLFGIEAKVI